ncbi:MAG: UDP-glucuronic acid decarboxylase family protein [bacterium]|nr:UDP-glucuronic acid decarboxylase family protein [bacterium]
MSKVVITGGAGFIGSHLCDRLLETGHEVIVVDNLFTGSKDNFVKHRDNSKFEFIRHDIINPLVIEADQIYHLACPASPIHYQHNPIKTIKTNVIGTLNMLGVAKRVKAKILLASTSEVYGDPLEHPQKESYWGNVNPIGPRSCYDEGKRVAETLAMNYHQQANVDVKIIRIFNTYGPRMLFNDGRVVSNFIVQALKGEDITLYGDGSQTRSFCYVEDLVKGMMAAMNREQFVGPVNLGNPNEMSISELASLIVKMTGTKSKLINKPLPKDDPIRRKPDISIASKELSWSPKVSLEEGLKMTIEDFKKRLSK